MLMLASGHRPYLESCMSVERILSSQQCLTSPENPHLSPSHVAVFNTRDQAVQNSSAFVGSWFWSQGPSMALAPAQDLVGVSLVPFLLRGGTWGQDATSGVPSCHGATCAVTGLPSCFPAQGQISRHHYCVHLGNILPTCELWGNMFSPQLSFRPVHLGVSEDWSGCWENAGEGPGA